MNKRHIIITLTIVFFIFVGALIFIAVKPTSAQSDIDKIYNLQKLEEIAEAGDILAQLRLIQFYSRDFTHRKDFDEREAYWKNKIEQINHTPEYLEASEVFLLEQDELRAKEEQKQAAMRARMEKLKEKYEGVKDKSKISEEQIWMDGLNAVFDVKSAYSWNKAYTWRYKMVVKIDTPEGVKTGASVHEVLYPPADGNAFARSNQGAFKGEAIYIDLGKRGIVFTVIPDAAHRFKQNLFTTFPTVPKIYDNSRWPEVIAHYGELRGVKESLLPMRYPMFVHFKNINDPSSIELVYKRKKGSIRDMRQVDTDRFEEVFGEGVGINDIVLEITNEPIEWKLDRQLPWIETMSDKDIKNALRKADPYIHLTNGFGYRQFRLGYKD